MNPIKRWRVWRLLRHEKKLQEVARREKANFDVGYGLYWAYYCRNNKTAASSAERVISRNLQCALGVPPEATTKPFVDGAFEAHIHIERLRMAALIANLTLPWEKEKAPYFGPQDSRNFSYKVNPFK